MTGRAAGRELATPGPGPTDAPREASGTVLDLTDGRAVSRALNPRAELRALQAAAVAGGAKATARAVLAELWAHCRYPYLHPDRPGMIVGATFVSGVTLAKRAGVTPSAISHQLRHLKDAGVLERAYVRRDRWRRRLLGWAIVFPEPPPEPVENGSRARAENAPELNNPRAENGPGVTRKRSIPKGLVLGSESDLRPPAPAAQRAAPSVPLCGCRWSPGAGYVYRCPLHPAEAVLE